MASSEAGLRWTGQELVFRGGADNGPEITVDSAGAEGPSPTKLLLLSLAGCMAIDIVMILNKSRVPVESLAVRIDGDRAESPPRRFTAIRMWFLVAGPGEEHAAKLDRAVTLSREKYCSVFHTLRQDIDISTEIESG